MLQINAKNSCIWSSLKKNSLCPISTLKVLIKYIYAPFRHTGNSQVNKTLCPTAISLSCWYLLKLDTVQLGLNPVSDNCSD